MCSFFFKQKRAYEITVVAVSLDRKSTRLNFSHTVNSYAVFCLEKIKLLTRGLDVGSIAVVDQTLVASYAAVAAILLGSAEVVERDSLHELIAVLFCWR